jgi:hypothetical protein
VMAVVESALTKEEIATLARLADRLTEAMQAYGEERRGKDARAG